MQNLLRSFLHTFTSQQLFIIISKSNISTFFAFLSASNDLLMDLLLQHFHNSLRADVVVLKSKGKGQQTIIFLSSYLIQTVPHDQLIIQIPSSKFVHLQLLSSAFTVGEEQRICSPNFSVFGNNLFIDIFFIFIFLLKLFRQFKQGR